jgi:hypothetical protein
MAYSRGIVAQRLGWGDLIVVVGNAQGFHAWAEQAAPSRPRHQLPPGDPELVVRPDVAEEGQTQRPNSLDTDLEERPLQVVPDVRQNPLHPLLVALDRAVSHAHQ